MTDATNSVALGIIDTILVVPEPKHSPLTIFSKSFPDGTISVLFQPNLCFKLIIHDPDGKELLSTSPEACQIHNSDAHPHTFQATWSLPGTMAAILVNGLLVASSDPAKVEATAYHVPPKPMGPTKDYTQQNATAALTRVRQLSNIYKNPGATKASKGYLFAALRNEALQLADLLKLLQEGRNHHAAGIAARVRLLLIPTKGRLGLLQVCAAFLEREVIVYAATLPQTTATAYDTNTPSLRLSMSLNDAPTALYPTAVDIDVWLGMPGASIGAKRLTNREVLAAIGNTIGAHTDPDLHPLVEQLIEARVGGGDLLLTAIDRVGSVILSACQTLLAQFPPK